jgi:hypothetical protein
MKQTLLTEIEAFLSASGLSASRFGFLAAKNARFVERLRKAAEAGKPYRVWPETEAQVRAFIAANQGRRRYELQAEAGRAA